MNILTYFILLVLGFCFAYIFELKEAYLIFYFILLSPFMDLLTLLLSKNSLEVNILVDNDYIDKNNMVFAKVKFNNKGRIPIARVKYKILLDEKFVMSDKDIKGEVSIAGRGSTYKELIVKPQHIGAATIIVKDIKIEGIFGLFKKIYNDEIKETVKILPSIVDVDDVDMIIGEGTTGEVEIENDYMRSVGEPGYEYREYIPSDPLNKVNWKLSSKTNNLIIRKDEASAKSKKILIIDSKIEDVEDKLILIDLLLEGTVGICKEIMRLEYDASFVYKKNNSWNEKTIEDDNSIEEIRRILADIYFTKDNNRFNGVDMIDYSEYDDVIIISSCRDRELLGVIDSIVYSCNQVFLISNNKRKIIKEQFYLNEDYSLERI